MPGTVFDYEPGRVEARFRQEPRRDRIWVELDLEGHVVTTTECDEHWKLSNPVDHPADSATCTCCMDSTLCPFPDFVRFLSAICTEVQECGFFWHAEGPSGEIKWRRCSLGDRTGYLEVNWYTDKNPFSHQVMVYMRQAVGMLYSAFRSTFVESPQYEPFRYEEFTLARAAELLISDASVETFAASMVEMDKEHAEAVLKALKKAAYARERSEGPANLPLAHFLRGEPITAADIQADRELIELLCGDSAPEVDRTGYGDLAPGWDAWGEEARLTELEWCLRSVRLFTDGGGSNLRELRSRIVEDWLL